MQEKILCGKQKKILADRRFIGGDKKEPLKQHKEERIERNIW